MPRVVSDEQWDVFFAAFRRGFSLYESGRMAGISDRTITRFMSGDPTCSGRRYLDRKAFLKEMEAGRGVA